MPHTIMQEAANRLAILIAGVQPQVWELSEIDTDSHLTMNAEYIYTVQPSVGRALQYLLESQATLHSENIDFCYYCNSKTNPLLLPCPVIELAREILMLEDTTKT